MTRNANIVSVVLDEIYQIIVLDEIYGHSSLGLPNLTKKIVGMKKVDNSSEFRSIIKSDKLTLIDFYADWVRRGYV